MTVAYVDHLDGLTGRLLLGALIDAGADGVALEAALGRRTRFGLTLSTAPVAGKHVRATAAHIVCDAPADLRLSDLLAFSDATPPLPQASAVWRRWFDAEAGVRGVAPAALTFQEFGDAGLLVEVLGVCEALVMLGVRRLYSVPLTLPAGIGQTSPSVAALAADRPVRAVHETAQMDPGGVALLTTLSDAFAPPPVFTLRAVGYGAEEAGRAGLIRVCLGDTEEADTDTADDIMVVEANIDDMNPQFYGHIVDLLLARGALDAYLTPVIMKKGRPGILLAALTDPVRLNDIVSTILSETTTIGVRMHPVARRKLCRRLITVDTRFGPVGVKLVRHGDRVRFAPEYDDCLRAAQAAGVPLAEVYDEARAAAARADLDGLL